MASESINKTFDYIRLAAVHLRTHQEAFFRTLAVGISGLGINSLILAVFVESAWLNYLVGAALATQGSTLWNFIWTERWVFGEGVNKRSWPTRIGGYFLMNNLFLILRTPMLAWFVDGIGLHYLLANVLSIGIMTMVRYFISLRWLWAKNPSQLRREAYWYDVHGLVRITSTARLPELEGFRVGERPVQPDIMLEVRPKSSLSHDPSAILYDEGLGDRGFWLQVRSGTACEVAVSPLLERSPHVLYTNVVEPILRWTLVRKGYALVHGACLVYKKRGIMISAATDTGKTTTVLKSLAAFPFEFLADDMVILGKDGLLLAYPKPLTISLHTLKAAPTADLTLIERLKLQIQSRVHSRLGRQIGIFIGNIRFPAATLNAYLQMVIPPPKFPIERLMPEVKQVEKTKLVHLAVIERGPLTEAVIPESGVYPTLARHTEDAYGFPPYPFISRQLSRMGALDLHQVESSHIRDAVSGLPAVLLRRDDYEWWRRLPAVFYGDLFGVEEPISSRYPTVPRGGVVESGG